MTDKEYVEALRASGFLVMLPAIIAGLRMTWDKGEPHMSILTEPSEGIPINADQADAWPSLIRYGTLRRSWERQASTEYLVFHFFDWLFADDHQRRIAVCAAYDKLHGTNTLMEQS